MKIKKEFIILALLIAALSTYLYVNKTGRLHYSLPTIPAVAGNSIMKIELHKADRDILLTQKDGIWMISPGDYPADKITIDRIVDTIANFSIDTLISDAGDSVRYDLGKDKKIDVTVSGSKGQLFAFAIGKRASTFRQTFVMIDGDARIFQAQGNFRNDFDLDVQGLRDKNVLPFSTASLSSIELKDNGKAISLKKKAVEDPGKKGPDTQAATGWTDDNDRDVPEAAMNEFFSLLTGLQCESYLDNRSKEDFEDPILSVTLKTGKSATLSLFAKEDQKDGGYPAVSSEQPSPFVLQKFKVELLQKAIREIRGEKSEPQAGVQRPGEQEK